VEPSTEPVAAVEASRPAPPDAPLLPPLELPVVPPLLELLPELELPPPLDDPLDPLAPDDVPPIPEEELAAAEPLFPGPASSPHPTTAAPPLQPATTVKTAGPAPIATSFEDHPRMDVLLTLGFSPQRYPTLAQQPVSRQRKARPRPQMPLPLTDPQSH
jgi:hypothetical protein